MSKRIEDLNIKLSTILNSIFDFLKIDLNNFSIDSDVIRGNAPCHNGDNPTAFILYKNNFKWRCWTHRCHDKYCGDLLGFIRAVKKVSLKDAIRIADYLIASKNIDINAIKKAKQKQVIINPEDTWKNHIGQKEYPIDFYGKLNSPDDFCHKRNLNLSLINSFKAGISFNNPWYGRFVIPIKNINGKIIGFTGRLIYENDKYMKWLHLPSSKNNPSGFKKDINLFNIDRAVDNIKNTINKEIVLVEGSIDVFKLIMAGIHNSVAILGSSISRGQIELLKKCNIIDIVIATDNDPAGKEGLDRIARRLESNLFNLYKCTPTKKDWGKMDINEIIEKFNNKEKL